MPYYVALAILGAAAWMLTRLARAGRKAHEVALRMQSAQGAVTLVEDPVTGIYVPQKALHGR
ncbi:MAG: hypothetical protein M3145_14080 [Pseudomonadota bacterium]|nr:hypothetical protein [Pseudomonadota bacterium]